MTLTDRCSRDSIEYLTERVEITRRSLARYAGTPCEPDYQAALERAQRRLIDRIAELRYQLETPEARIVTMTEAGYPAHDDDHADRY